MLGSLFNRALRTPNSLANAMRTYYAFAIRVPNHGPRWPSS